MKFGLGVLPRRVRESVTAIALWRLDRKMRAPRPRSALKIDDDDLP
jgi:hypothetical protein